MRDIALEDLIKLAAEATAPKIPKEVTDPFGQLNVHMSDGADYGSIVGQAIPIVGPVVGGVVGKYGVGLAQGVKAHQQAAERYERESGKKLALPVRHPFATAALSAAGLFPVGAAPMGPVAAMGLVHATKPKGPEEADDKSKILSKPYAHLAAQQAHGELIGGGIGGTIGTIAGRHVGTHHAAEINAGLDKMERVVHHAANAAHATPLANHLDVEQRLTNGLKHIASQRAGARTLKYGLGIGGAALGVMAGSMVGKIPGLISTMREHREVAENYEKSTGKKLPGLVKSPYIPYIASGVVAGPAGLGGLKNKAFDLAVQYKMDPDTKPVHSMGDDVRGFGDFLHKRWFR